MVRTILVVIGVLLAWKSLKFAANLFAAVFMIIGMAIQENYHRENGDRK